MKGIIRKPNIFDIKYISDNARDMDIKEVLYMSGSSIYECLTSTPDIYENSFVWEVDNKIVCIFGTTPFKDNKHVIWLLATNYFDDYKNIFKKICKKVFLNTIKNKYYLYNYVYAGHEKAIRWIKWLGFKVYDPEPVGINGELFCKFEVYNNV